MGLYDREYMNRSANERSTGGYINEESRLVSFVKQTYQLFAGSLLAGAAGAYVAMPFAEKIHSMYWPLIILEFILLFGMNFTKKIAGINLLTMFSFVFITGVTSVPLLSSVLGMEGGASIIGNAFAMTAIVVGGMSYIGIKSKKDFTSYGKALFISLIVIIVFSLLNVIFFHNPLISVGISGIAVLLFSFMTVIDTQNIINGRYETPIEGAIALYLDFLNIFLSLVQILGFLRSDD